MLDLFKKSMLTGVGLALKTWDEVEALGKELEEKGKMPQEEAKKFLEELQERYEETQAKLEDLKTEERVLKGTTIAGAAGSGVKVGMGSPLEVLAEQARNFAKERMTVSQVGASKASSTMMRGQMAGRKALYQGWGQGLQQASQGMKSAFGMM